MFVFLKSFGSLLDLVDQCAFNILYIVVGSFESRKKYCVSGVIQNERDETSG